MSNEELTGRRLDIAIVERVMGWLPPGDPATKAMRSRLRLTHPSYNDHYLTPEGELRKPPYYAVDPAATMEVIEKLRSEGFTVEISSDHPDPEWDVAFVRREILTANAHKVITKGEASDVSLLEAIRRAALASLPEIKDCEEEKFLK